MPSVKVQIFANFWICFRTPLFLTFLQFTISSYFLLHKYHFLWKRWIFFSKYNFETISFLFTIFFFHFKYFEIFNLHSVPLINIIVPKSTDAIQAKHDFEQPKERGFFFYQQKSEINWHFNVILSNPNVLILCGGNAKIY